MKTPPFTDSMISVTLWELFAAWSRGRRRDLNLHLFLLDRTECIILGKRVVKSSLYCDCRIDIRGEVDEWLDCCVGLCDREIGSNICESQEIRTNERVATPTSIGEGRVHSKPYSAVTDFAIAADVKLAKKPTVATYWELCVCVISGRNDNGIMICPTTTSQGPKEIGVLVSIDSRIATVGGYDGELYDIINTWKKEEMYQLQSLLCTPNRTVPRP